MRSSLSFHRSEGPLYQFTLNVAEGCLRKSAADRKRFYEIARGSAIEIDTAIGIAFKLSYVTMEQLKGFEKLIITTFKILSGLIGR